MGWKSIFVVALLIVGGIGYYLWSKVEEAPKEATLPGYTNALKNDEARAQGAVSTFNVQNVKEAVEKYRSMKGTNPAALQDLVPEFIDHIPGGVTYDPATGTVSAVQ